MLATAKSSTQLLRNVHEGLGKPEPGVTTLVDGDYEYWHSVCDGYDDLGWGCGYRTLQTLSSWVVSNQRAKPPVPSIPEIQQILVDLEDKLVSFLGSNFWIGTFEACLTLDHRYDVRSKIIHVDSGANLVDHKKTIERHFLDSRCPIMMGGDKDCVGKGIVGIHMGERNTYLLIVDPHFCGKPESIKQLQKDGYVLWRNINDFDHSSFYNMCLPQVGDL